MKWSRIKLNLKTYFRDYETYSSLTELSVLAMLDSDFGIEIEMKDFNNYKTVGDLIKLVSPKIVTWVYYHSIILGSPE